MGLAKGLQCGMDNVADLGPETQEGFRPLNPTQNQRRLSVKAEQLSKLPWKI